MTWNVLSVRRLLRVSAVICMAEIIDETLLRLDSTARFTAAASSTVARPSRFKGRDCGQWYGYACFGWLPLGQAMRADAATCELISGRYVRMYPFPANMNITLAAWPQKLGGTNNPLVVPGF